MSINKRRTFCTKRWIKCRNREVTPCRWANASVDRPVKNNTFSSIVKRRRMFNWSKPTSTTTLTIVSNGHRELSRRGEKLKSSFDSSRFIGTFKVKNVGASRVRFFTIIDVHLRPDAAYLEFLHLRHVIRDFILRNAQYFTTTSSSLAEAIAANVIDATASNKPHLKTDHPILLVGDFNADCSYISASRQETLR